MRNAQHKSATFDNTLAVSVCSRLVLYKSMPTLKHLPNVCVWQQLFWGVQELNLTHICDNIRSSKQCTNGSCTKSTKRQIWTTTQAMVWSVVSGEVWSTLVKKETEEIRIPVTREPPSPHYYGVTCVCVWVCLRCDVHCIRTMVSDTHTQMVFVFRESVGRCCPFGAVQSG